MAYRFTQFTTGKVEYFSDEMVLRQSEAIDNGVVPDDVPGRRERFCNICLRGNDNGMNEVVTVPDSEMKSNSGARKVSMLDKMKALRDSQ